MVEQEFSEAVHVGGVSFIYFPGDCGGRLIPAAHIKSIVPDFKGSGSMVFLTDSDKAVKVDQSPKKIADDLIEPPTSQAD
jgi:hypothetical protein